MPRWTIHSAWGGLEGEGARVQTMCLPTRRTERMTRFSRPAAWVAGGAEKGSGWEPNHASVMRSPWRRWWTPRAMVSTSGSSGIFGF